MLLVLFLASPALAGDEEYKLGPDSMRQEGVPQGTVTKEVWHGKVFPETVRDYWVYVPKQYDGTKPACVMVFQDGHTYVGEKGDFCVPVVFDNLIHKGEMPVTIGVFINPGHVGEQPPQNPWGASNRSFEYDTLSDQYARFLLEEILPEVGKKYKLTEDPECRAICGISSGGICAFTVAWQRPDAFRKVLSHVGSFTNIRGGHVSVAHPLHAREAHWGVPPGRQQRPGQPARELVAGKPGDGRGPEVQAVRLQVRGRHRQAQRQARRGDPAGFAALALATATTKAETK